MTLEAREVALFRIPKRHAELRDCEDAAGFDAVAGLFAVGDGASASPNAWEWAGFLVDGFVADPFRLTSREGFSGWLGCRVSEWARGRQNDSHDVHDWWVEEVKRRGSWSTLNMCRLSASPDSRTLLDIGAVGDSITFLVRKNQIVDSFPRLSIAEFGSHPELVGSTGRARARTVGAYESASFVLERHDVVLMCTDALAAVVLEHERPVSQLLSLLAEVDDEGFSDLVSVAREQGHMADDDVTMLRFRLRDSD